jgi:TIR domain
MRVFLSYASEDRKLAEAIYLSLRAHRHTVFFDRTDLPSINPQTSLTKESSRRWVVARPVAARTARRILPAMLRSG